MYQKLEVNEE